MSEVVVAVHKQISNTEKIPLDGSNVILKEPLKDTRTEPYVDVVRVQPRGGAKDEEDKESRDRSNDSWGCDCNGCVWVPIYDDSDECSCCCCCCDCGSCDCGSCDCGSCDCSGCDCSGADCGGASCDCNF